MKPHRITLKLVSKENTPKGAIPISKSIKMIDDFGKLAKKHKMDCFIEGEKASVLEYEPTNLEYKMKTLEDIAELSAEQFEMFIEDLRGFCNVRRQMKILNDVFGESVKISDQDSGMIWMDTGKHEQHVEFSVKGTNNISK